MQTLPALSLERKGYRVLLLARVKAQALTDCVLVAEVHHAACCARCLHQGRAKDHREICSRHFVLVAVGRNPEKVDEAGMKGRRCQGGGGGGGGKKRKRGGVKGQGREAGKVTFPC